ncbi:MAG: hypothetical protein ACRYF6_13700 [Janthinobacterium lividum]
MKQIIPLFIGAATLICSPVSIAAEQKAFSQAQICRATIGTVMGRDPKIVKIDKVDADDIYTSYRRKDDGTQWSNRCRVDVTRVYWATPTGRWRVHPLDEVITYSVTPTTLTIHRKFNDGSSLAKSYTHAQLGAK